MLKYKLILSDPERGPDTAGVIIDGLVSNGHELCTVVTDAAAIVALASTLSDRTTPGGPATDGKPS